jgi:hypothetical protein
LEHQRQSVTTIYNDIGGMDSYPEGHDPAKPYCAGWGGAVNGNGWRYVYLPPGMSPEEAERLLSK